MRLFMSVEPSDAAQLHLDDALARCRDRYSDLAWVPSWQRHLILAVIGNMAGYDVAGLQADLSRELAACPPLRLAVNGVGASTTAREGAVAWAELSGDVQELTRLAHMVHVALHRAGFLVDRRLFQPHIPIVQAGSPKGLAPVLDALAGYRGPVFTVPQVTLARSVMNGGPNGTVTHQGVGQIPLEAVPA